MKRNIARVLFGLPGLFILLSGLMFLLNPEAASAKLMLEPQSIDGLSNLRGFLGAPVIAVGVSLILGGVTAKLEYVRPGVIFVLALITARIVSRVIDGPAESFVLYVAIPSTVFALLFVGHKLLDAAEAEAA